VALARFESEQRRRSQDLAGGAVLESDRALALGEEARELARLIGTRAYQERLAASLAGLPGPVRRPAAADPQPEPPRPDYQLPVAGRLVTGVGEISDAGVHARGLTFATAAEAEVVAPMAGRIVYASAFRGYGQVLIIDHGGGWQSVITDLADIEVAAGDSVRRGQRLGRAGSDAPRVTVELRRGGRPIAIAPLLAG
jgi:septal ring factor EnvC (AmiA/AmiB activator)